MSVHLQIDSDTLKQEAVLVRRYLINHFPKNNQRVQFLNDDMSEYPDLWINYLKSYYTNRDENFLKFTSDFFDGTKVAVLLGQRRKGKTSLLLKLAETAHFLGKKVIAFNVGGDLPDWIEVREFDRENPYSDLPNNCFIIHDECHLDIDSKSWSSKQNLKVRDFISTIGHRDQWFIFSSQLASNISLDLIRYADCRIFKKMNLLNIDSDRADYFSKFSNFYPKEIPYFFADIDSQEVYFCRYDLPDFFDEKISKAFT